MVGAGLHHSAFMPENHWHWNDVEKITNEYGYKHSAHSLHDLKLPLRTDRRHEALHISRPVRPLESVHTPDECMNVASVERTWEYLMEILKSL